jgi:glutamine synthetase adenylyltransferase
VVREFSPKTVTVGSDWLTQTLGRRMVAAVVDWAVAEMAKRRGVSRRSAIVVVVMGELGKIS